MDLDLTSDQELMRETVARFVQSACPLSAVRELSQDGAAPPDGYRHQAAQLGWFAMLVPEEFGGGTVSGNGVVDAAIIAEERGRYLQPGPFVPTNAVACGVTVDGSPEQRAEILPGLAGGTSTATWAIADATGEWRPDGGGVFAEAHGGGYVLTGSKGLVQDADTSDWILVACSVTSGPTQFLVRRDTAGVSVRPLDGLDLTRSFSEVTFDRVELPETALLGRLGHAHEAIERQLQVAIVLTVAECVGAMEL